MTAARYVFNVQRDKHELCFNSTSTTPTRLFMWVDLNPKSIYSRVTESMSGPPVACLKRQGPSVALKSGISRQQTPPVVLSSRVIIAFPSIQFLVFA